MSEIAVIYTGPLASGTIVSPYADEVYEFTAGEKVTVPEWLAKGHPGEPGTCDAGDGPVPFTSHASLPVGAAVLEEPIPPIGGLRAQSDAWKLATHGKEKKTAPPEPVSNESDTKGEGA